MKSYVVQFKTEDGDLKSKVLNKNQLTDFIKNHGGNDRVISVFSFTDDDTLVRLRHRITDLIEVTLHEIRNPNTGFLELMCFTQKN